VEIVFVNLIRELLISDHVYLLAGHAGSPANVRSRAILSDAGIDSASLHILPIPTDDVWIRDYGPISVRSAADHAIHRFLNWGYNAWGGKYPPYDSDDAVPGKLSDLLNRPLHTPNMILEGGSIDTNGEGILLTTESVLLNPNRNPHFDREAIESRLMSELGQEQIIWLGSGLQGDDTDGHIDDLARFIDRDTIVATRCKDPDDVNHATLEENLERLKAARTLSGVPFRIVELPMPDTRTSDPTVDGSDHVPSSYANFYIANGRLLMPAYDPRTDGLAVEILSGLRPDLEVVPLDCRDLVWGQGSIHCVTQQLHL
jgi:agmatine deiminase